MLEEYRARGERLKVSQVGLLNTREDVSPDLADAVFESIKVRGVLKASPAVLERLKPKIDRVRARRTARTLAITTDAVRPARVGP